MTSCVSSSPSSSNQGSSLEPSLTNSCVGVKQLFPSDQVITNKKKKKSPDVNFFPIRESATRKKALDGEDKCSKHKNSIVHVEKVMEKPGGVSEDPLDALDDLMDTYDISLSHSTPARHKRLTSSDTHLDEVFLHR